MNLYMISLGGKVKGCNVEVHDVQFIAANRVEDTIEILKKHWYGLQEKLHMDSYKMITGADGFKLNLTKNNQDDDRHLFFVHLGGYKNESTQEQHDIALFVGESEQTVKERAREEASVADIQNHVDHIVNVENCLLSSDGERYYVELIKCDEVFEQEPDWFGYRRLDKEI